MSQQKEKSAPVLASGFKHEFNPNGKSHTSVELMDMIKTLCEEIPKHVTPQDLVTFLATGKIDLVCNVRKRVIETLEPDSTP